MQWTPQQDAALKAVDRWLGNPDQQVFRLFGFAGTGKTTLAKHFAEGVDGDVLFGAYTGKAAHVLRQKGCSGADTMHSHMYHSSEKSTALLKELEADLAECMGEIAAELRAEGWEAHEIKAKVDEASSVRNLREKIKLERGAAARPNFTLNTESDIRYAKLMCVDEISMVGPDMGQDLLSFGTKILVLGDPAQLPPVDGAGFFTEGCEPDFMLTDIRRQARDNPIIELATRVRQGERLKPGTYGESRVLRVGERVPPEEVLAADQVLVGRNKTRHASNSRVRKLQGINDQLPTSGERLVCLRNDKEVGLLNGAIWNVHDVGEVDMDDQKMVITVVPEDDGAAVEVIAHTHHFLGKSDELGWWQKRDAQELGFGYALTVHKSQGSQWNDIVLFDESGCFRDKRDRWLYTGITRAAETIKVASV